jgi:hypothetical protein
MLKNIKTGVMVDYLKTKPRSVQTVSSTPFYGFFVNSIKSTNYTDFYKSDDGITFVRKSTQTNMQGGSATYGVQLSNEKLILCNSFTCITSIDSGENWSSNLSISVNNVFVSNRNIISNITDGESIYLYSSNGKVLYGKL